MLCSVIPVILKDLMGEGETVDDWLKRGAAFMEGEISKGPSTRGGLDEWRITGGPQAGPVW